MNMILAKQSDDGNWDVKLTGNIAPKDLTRFFRSVKVQYRYHVRNQRLEGITSMAKEAMIPVVEESIEDIKLKGDLDHVSKS